ncbi:MAG: hypothetical protein ACHRHE_07910 [Tepidisphaerales bacterium]
MSHNTYNIDTRPAAKPAATPVKPPRTLLIWVSGIVGLALCAAGGVYLWRSRPLPLPSPQGEHLMLARFVGTDQFARLPLAKQEEYVRPLLDNRWELLEAIRTGKLTREEAEKGMQNAGMIAFNLQARDYFSLATQQQRDAMADQLIDEQERTRALMGAFRLGPSTRPAGDTAGNASSASAAGAPPAGPRGSMDAARIKSRIENTDPLTRARIAEFMGAMQARRNTRGLPPLGRR